MRRALGRGRPERRVQGTGQPVVGAVAPFVVVIVLSATLVVFDLDGTLLDSDAALVAPFVALGVAPSDITFGHVVADECARLGVSVEAYLSGYDVDVAQPFPGVDDVVRALDGRWAVCSNKAGALGRAELARLGWTPTLALFAEDFGGSPKRLEPVLAALDVAADVLFVGDTEHDRACAAAAGVPFVLAGWNPRALAVAQPGDVVLERPVDLLARLARSPEA